MYMRKIATKGVCVWGHQIILYHPRGNIIQPVHHQETGIVHLEVSNIMPIKQEFFS